jgi:hypothetical protein
MKIRRPFALAGSLVGLALALAGCSARTDVSLTGNTPAQYSHVWITTQEVWFNESATAGPDDSGWAKFPLSTPTTIDLVAEGGGNLANITTDLKVIPGTYSQVRIIPIDPSVALTSSAQTAGAMYNSEADYVDSSGNTHQLPLEFLNPDKGIGIQTGLKVPVGDVGAALGAASAEGASGTTIGTGDATSTAGTTIGSGAAFGTSTDTTTGTTGTVGTSTVTATPNSFAVFEDGTRDLVPFTFSGTPGVMLSSHAAAYDLSKVGAISGQLTLTNITTSTSGLPAIQVSAQVLSADGSRHEVVATTAVQSDGSFLLYPLATNSEEPAYYDVVIHGPNIATIIIKSVEVTLPSTTTTPLLSTDTSDSTDLTDTTDTTTGTTTATTTTPTTTTSTTTNATVTPISVGTLTPRAANYFTANVATSPAATLPAGSTVVFYQTIARSGEVPYVIEWSAIDPFNETLFTPQSLSAATLDSGTWSTSGGAITIVSAAPAQGAGKYVVSAIAPSYSDGALSYNVGPPSGAATTTIQATPLNTTALPFNLPALSVAAGSTGTLHATVSQASAGKYDSGELLVSYNGTLVASAPIGAGFASGSASVTVSGLPAEIPAAEYYVSVRAWNSSSPSGTLARQWYPNLVDLRATDSASLSLTVN